MTPHRPKRTKLDDNVDPKTVTVEENGDLQLVVGSEGGKSTTYVVCSRALARHSPVFKAMLFGNFAEARPADGSQWVVHVSEDNQHVLPLFLSIVHGCFKDVPTKLHIQELGALLVILEKYDALPLIRPWAKGWIEHVWAWSRRHDGYCSQLICIAWVTGHREIFDDNVHNAIYFCPANGQELQHGFQFADHEAIHPPGLFEYLGKLRDDILKTLMAPYLEIYRALVHRRSPEHNLTFQKCIERSKGDDERFTRESTVLGSLILGFSRRGIDITQEDFKYSHDLEKFKRLLSNFPVKTSNGHQTCASRIRSRLGQSHEEEKLLRVKMSTVIAGHSEHIQKQAQKTGLDEDKQAGFATESDQESSDSLW